MSVGEMIASHHFHDALCRAREADKAFRATELGRAFTWFESAVGNAWRLDTELGFTDRGDKAAKRAWVNADQATQHFRVLLERLMERVDAPTPSN